MYDLIVIGAGPGGYVAAAKAAREGLKTLVIEKDALGGICLNKGCIPAKTLLSSAKRLQDVRDAKTHGVKIDGEISFDWKEMQKRKDRLVSRLNKGIETLFKQSGAEWKIGEAKVLSPNKVQLGEETFETKNLLLATGAKALKPQIPGMDSLYKEGIAKTAAEILFLEEIPKKLLILGDNVFAVEYASLFSLLGSEVSILAPSEGLLPYMDGELAQFLKRELERQKIKIHPKAKVNKFEGKTAYYQKGEKEDAIDFDIVLLSLGATPNLTGLEALHLEMNDRGFPKVDEYLRTSVKGVYAIGDLNGYFPLAHVASAEGLVAVSDILGKARPMRYDRLPMAVYSLPELASVGLREEKAKEIHGEVRVSKYFLSANGKALAEGDSKGFVKILSIPPYEEVVGMHIAGNKATDLIAEGVLALQLEATLHDLAAAIHAHPTPSEIIMEAAAGVL